MWFKLYVHVQQTDWVHKLDRNTETIINLHYSLPDIFKHLFDNALNHFGWNRYYIIYKKVSAEGQP